MMNRKRMISGFIVVCLLLVASAIAYAGGWATVELDERPLEVYAEDSFRLGFTVLQHGHRPVHHLGDEWPIEPYLEATHVDTGTAVRFDAQPTKKEGHFIVDVTLPEAGEWEWRIEPYPLAMTTEFAPLTVSPALVSSVQTNQAEGFSLLALAGLVLMGLLVVGTAVFLWSRRRTQLAAGAVG